MFAFILRVAQSTWSKIIEFTTLAAAFMLTGVQRTARILAPSSAASA